MSWVDVWIGSNCVMPPSMEHGDNGDSDGKKVRWERMGRALSRVGSADGLVASQSFMLIKSIRNAQLSEN